MVIWTGRVSLEGDEGEEVQPVPGPNVTILGEREEGELESNYKVYRIVFRTEDL